MVVVVVVGGRQCISDVGIEREIMKLFTKVRTARLDRFRVMSKIVTQQEFAKEGLNVPQ